MKIGYLLLGMSMAASAGCLCAAQDTSQPPKVLQITREFLKPGKAGMIHDKSESNFVQAMERAKWPTHYIALNSMSGKSRALYLTGYDSFADWQKDNDAADKNAALSSELDRLAVADGDLLSDLDQFVFYYQPDQSLRVGVDLPHMRYFEVTVFRLHPGHHKEWSDLVKLVIDGHKKANTSASWAMYELEYGGGDEYVLLSPDKGLGDIDEGFAEDKKWEEAVGEDGLKKVETMAADCIESSDSELFSVNPKQSYAPEDWVKANPDFWKPKATLAAAKPAEKAKPAAAAKPAGQ
jgi:hypothetical protein